MSVPTLTQAPLPPGIQMYSVSAHTLNIYRTCTLKVSLVGVLDHKTQRMTGGAVSQFSHGWNTMPMILDAQETCSLPMYTGGTQATGISQCHWSRKSIHI